MATKRGGKFWGRVRLNGQSVSQSFATLIDAERWEAATKQAIQDGKTVATLVPSVGKFFDQSVDYLWADSSNLEGQRKQAKALALFFGENKPVNHVTNADAIAFRSQKLKEGRAGSTLNNYAATFNRLMKHAAGLGFVDSETPAMEYTKQRKGRVRFLEPDEEAGILRWFTHIGRDDYADYVTILVNTGARIGECIKLTWQDLRIDTVTFWDTKSGHPRTVPLNKAARAAFDRRRAAGQDKPFKVVYTTFKDAYDKALAMNNLDDVNIHTLRHTCASRLVQGGVDIRRVKDWLGHSAIQTTMIYAHLAPKDLFVGASVLDTVYEGAEVLKFGTNTGTKTEPRNQ